MQAVVASGTKNEDDVKAESVAVVSSFELPRYSYEPSTNTYYYKGNRFPLHADAQAKLAIYDERLQLITARLMRHPHFAVPLPGSKKQYIKLARVDDLAATAETSVHVTMIGVLTQPEDGLYCLEDASGAVAVDLTHMERQMPGLYTETCIVLVEGEYYPDAYPAGFEPAGYRHPAAGAGAASSSSTGGAGAGAGGGGGVAAKFVALTDGRLPGVLRISTLGHPPIEGREVTMRAMQTVDPFRVLTTPREVQTVFDLQCSPDAQNAMIVAISDVHLDKPSVLEGIRRMLEGFRSTGTVPLMICFMGNFGSRPYGHHQDDRHTYKAGFDALADILCSYPEISQSCTYVLVPGPHDPGSAPILPRCGLPRTLCTSLVDNAEMLPKVILTTNPCRIRFFTQELVLFRHELSLRLRRRAVVPPHPKPTLAEPVMHSMAKTIVHQAHLCPLPLSAQPVHWEYDYALRLHPLPDAVIIGEDQAQYNTVHADDSTMVFNPGSFAADQNFSVYWPGKREVSQSNLREIDSYDPYADHLHADGDHDDGAQAHDGGDDHYGHGSGDDGESRRYPEDDGAGAAAADVGRSAASSTSALEAAIADANTSAQLNVADSNLGPQQQYGDAVLTGDDYDDEDEILHGRGRDSDVSPGPGYHSRCVHANLAVTSCV